MLADLVKKSPENKAAIDALRDKISKKEAEKKSKEREFYRTKQTEEVKEREEEIKKQNEDEKIINDENAFSPGQRSRPRKNCTKEMKSLLICRL